MCRKLRDRFADTTHRLSDVSKAKSQATHSVTSTQSEFMGSPSDLIPLNIVLVAYSAGLLSFLHQHSIQLLVRGYDWCLPVPKQDGRTEYDALFEPHRFYIFLELTFHPRIRNVRRGICSGSGDEDDLQEASVSFALGWVHILVKFGRISITHSLRSVLFCFPC